MSARPSDPVEVLPPVACVRSSHRFIACEPSTDWIAAARERMPTPDERAAFALAREALATAPSTPPSKEPAR